MRDGKLLTIVRKLLNLHRYTLSLGISCLACTLLFADEGPDILPIGTVQGPVLDKHDGHKHKSPFNKKQVIVQGVVYQKTLSRTKAGTPVHGLYVQNTKSTADDRDVTSDGIWAYLKSSPAIGSADGPYEPQIGDELVLRGKISERYGQTQLQNLYLVSKLRSDVDVDKEVPATDVNPPSDLRDAGRYWERIEGMRCRIPAGAVTMGSRSVFASTSDAEIWVIRHDHPVAQREDPLARRVYRDAHPLDDVPGQLFDNDNGYRILIGSQGIKAAANNNLTMIRPVRTFDTISYDVVGGLTYAYGKYAIHAERQVLIEQGADPYLIDPVPDIDRNKVFSVATFNAYNLYDFRDDPYDGCDFRGNSGCPDVSKPLNYAPESDAAYQQRLTSLAKVIADVLGAPDILMLQEIEDQDICRLKNNLLEVTDQNNADGQLDVLQDLAHRIEQLGGPTYAPACDRDGADHRGIIAPFMYRIDRVELVAADEGDHVLGSEPRVPYRARGISSNSDISNPKALNAELPGDVKLDHGDDARLVFSRPIQIAHFRVWQERLGVGPSEELFCLNNHFSSRPDQRITRRVEQAQYSALVVATIEKQHTGARIIMGGDLNVFPRPDDPAPENPTDQLASLYASGLANTYDWLLEQKPRSAYTSIYEGQANTLDQLFLSPNLYGRLDNVVVAHINSDWPKRGDHVPAGRGMSDHDPMLVYLRFTEHAD